MANKKTQKEWFVEIKAFAEAQGREDFAEFIQGRIEALDKKAEAKKPTKEQVANEGLKDAIVEFLGGVEKATATEIGQGVEGVKSSQKATALLRQLVEAKRVVKETDKKKVFFKVAAE